MSGSATGVNGATLGSGCLVGNRHVLARAIVMKAFNHGADATKWPRCSHSQIIVAASLNSYGIRDSIETRKIDRRPHFVIYTYQKLKLRKRANEVDGFTLIEILIVIVVLGILAAVVIYALSGIGSKSAVAACEADGATVTSALAAFNTQNPTQFDNVAGSGSNPPVTYSPLTAEALLSSTSYGAPYIQSWPNNYPHYAFILRWTLQTADIWSEELYVATGETQGGTAPNYTYSGAGDGTGPGNLVPSGSPAADIPGSGANAGWILYSGPGTCTGVK